MSGAPRQPRRKPTHAFKAVIEDAGGGGAYVVVPFDVERVFGRKRVKVQAWFDDVSYRGSLVRMGTACHILGIRKDIRAQLGKSVGDAVDVTVVEDTKDRVVEAPADLRQALRASKAARASYAELAYTNQKAYVDWIEAARRTATRRDRVARAVALLAEGKKRPRAASR